MTLFAASIAGLFPIIHLGRPMYFYWLTPYPNTMALWPQWRSALIWDFWAILELPDLLDPVLVCRPYPRSRHDAGSRPQQVPRDGVWRAGAWMARRSGALAGLRDPASHARLSRRAARCLAAQRGGHGLRRKPHAGLAGDDLSRRTSWSAPCIPVSRWSSASPPWCVGAFACRR